MYAVPLLVRNSTVSGADGTPGDRVCVGVVNASADGFQAANVRQRVVSGRAVESAVAPGRAAGRLRDFRRVGDRGGESHEQRIGLRVEVRGGRAGEVPRRPREAEAAVARRAHARTSAPRRSPASARRGRSSSRTRRRTARPRSRAGCRCRPGTRAPRRPLPARRRRARPGAGGIRSASRAAPLGVSAGDGVGTHVAVELLRPVARVPAQVAPEIRVLVPVLEPRLVDARDRRSPGRFRR